VFVVGLTGGIGTGKSTLAALLAERGAQVIDADAIGRDALRPGERAWHSVVGQFGDEILEANGMEIDRKRLARIVFEDERKLATLNAIVHPVIFDTVAEQLDRLRHSDAVVVLDAALIVEAGLEDAVDVLVVVDTKDKEERAQRMVRERGMSFDDFRARVASQKKGSELLARADVVISNDGSLDDLAREADRLWSEVEVRRA
jgi:dephospho-CoA kinase